MQGTRHAAAPHPFISIISDISTCKLHTQPPTGPVETFQSSPTAAHHLVLFLSFLPFVFFFSFGEARGSRPCSLCRNPSFSAPAYTADCQVCGKDYLVLVEFCHDFHPPLLFCPWGMLFFRHNMRDGQCPSPVCPNSLRGGCRVM
ncbi:hypothetical protein EDB81DRAFT_341761 [Dactylonectria macrodidyma]|uniref:Uncharacterized protein n=1 Tax=Dactylonectria macrodidyma TaxID=307937 RepID=A0A9P9JH61_9HYPO|nr:hypothetical protein EDB81DRAFT_341761 [Dactylonectria macrodidyma]